AIFIAILADYLSRPAVATQTTSLIRRATRTGRLYLGPLACVVVIGAQGIVNANGNIVTLQAGQYGFDCSPARNITLYMAEYYTGGKVLKTATDLMDGLEPSVGIPFKNVVYEGSGTFWKQAISEPAPDVEWIILNPKNPTDPLTKALNTTN